MTTRSKATAPSSSGRPTSAPQQFALVPQQQQQQQSSQTALPDGVRDDCCRCDHRDGRTVRQELTSIYETYAALYPNPDLQAERQERHRLLQATSAAQTAVALNPRKEKRSWFWGKAKKEKEETPADDDTLDEDDRLVYTEDHDDNDDDDTMSEEALHHTLLGTQCGLDPTKIPRDAHALARRHLVGRGPNVARTTWHTPGTARLVLTGLGTVTEWLTTDGSAMVTQETSDRSALMEYARERGGSEASLRNARAATIGPNVLCVSWGFADGATIFYRRCHIVGGGAETRSASSIGWQAMAVVGPTADVRGILEDVFDETTHEADGCALLAVSDVVPLVVELDRNQPPVVAVAIGRLGGFVELVPLPPRMWYGPVLQLDKPDRRTRSRKPGDHYANKLPDLNANNGGNITVIPTGEYHDDVIGIEAFRTSVDANDDSVVWDQEAYPHAPPAEFVVAAHGVSTNDGSHSCITFWSVATMLQDESSEAFTLEASLMDVFDVDVGPEITLMATPGIFKHWRKPRQVDLRGPGKDEAGQQVKRVTSLSIPVPLKGISFLVVSSEKKSGARFTSSVRAALHDWNGGCTILNCDILERAVSHRLSPDEYAMVYPQQQQEGDDSEDIDCLPMSQILQSRAQCVQQFATSTDRIPPHIHCVQWWETPAPEKSDGAAIALAVMTSGQRCTLRLVYSKTFSRIESTDDDLNDYKTYIISCSELAVKSLHRFGNLNSKKLHLTYVTSQVDEKNGRSLAYLNMCALQELTPSDIVQSFVRSNKHKEAIVASDGLTVAQQDSIKEDIDSCRKHLWELELDFMALENVKDDAYVIQQVLHVDPDSSVNIELYRSMCRLALQKLKTVRLGASLAIASSVEERQSVLESLESRLVRLGTYDIICAYLGCEPLLSTFLASFLDLPLIDVANSFACEADMFALSAICFRHRKDLAPHWCDVIDRIPLPVLPSAYQHLLPIETTESDEGVHFFSSATTADETLTLSEMPNFLNQMFGFEVVIDDEDEALVFEKGRNAVFASELGTNLETWYTKRALAIQSFVSTLDHQSSFSNLALRALKADASTIESSSPSIKSLHSLARFADSVKNIVPDKNDTKLMESMAKLGLEDFAEMNASELVSTIMNCKGDSVDLHARFSQYLLPMLEEKISTQDEKSFHGEVDKALESFCSTRFEEILNGTNLLDAVILCSKIVWSSRTSVDISLRLIKDKGILINVVMKIVTKAAECADLVEVDTDALRQTLGCLWKMYESLPSKHPSLSTNQNGIMDVLYKDIIFFDIVSKWPDTNAFSLFRERRLQNSTSDNGVEKLSALGTKAVVALCQSFCEQIRSRSSSVDNSSAVVALLSSLLKDIEELSHSCFDITLALKDLVTMHLFKPLLIQQEIWLIGEFLSHADSHLVDSELISREVQQFFSDAVDGAMGSEASNRGLKAAMECQDVLGSFLPELRHEFQSSRKYLDAAHYVNTTLLSSTSFRLEPKLVKKMKPVDVVDYVLECKPDCIVLNCSDWANPVWAKQANETIRKKQKGDQAMAMGIDPASAVAANLPPLPGEALFHLASLLELHDRSSVVAVKSRAIYFAISAKLYGAASAICRTLIANPNVSNACNAPILDSIATIVSQENYKDDFTKRELCSAALAFHTTNLNSTTVAPFDAIVKVWNRICHHEQITNSMACSLPLNSVGRLYLDTRAEYSTEMRELFTTLYFQLSDCVIDDALLVALARYSAFWCIGRSTRPKRQAVSPMESLSTQAIVALLASLILQIKDGDVSENTSRELTSIFEQQEAASQTRGSSSTNWSKPDLSIVQSLIGRGYSECGARRAAGMTKNASFDVALQWAVTHSLDYGFDDPVAIFQSSDDTFVDEESARAFTKAFNAIQSIQSDSETLQSILERVTRFEFSKNGEESKDATNPRQNVPAVNVSNTPKVAAQSSPTTAQKSKSLQTDQSQLGKAGTLNNTKQNKSVLRIPTKTKLKVPGDTSKAAQKIQTKGSLQTAPASVPPPINAVDKPKVDATSISNPILHKKEAHVSASGTPPVSFEHTAPVAIVADDLPVSTTRSPPKSDGTSAQKVKLPALKPVLKTGGVAVSAPPPPAAAASKLVINIPLGASPARCSSTTSAASQTNRRPPPARAALEQAPSSAPTLQERSALRQVGQAAFQSTRSAASPASDERRRLIEEGRRLLQQARSSSPTKLPSRSQSSGSSWQKECARTSMPPSTDTAASKTTTTQPAVLVSAASNTQTQPLPRSDDDSVNEGGDDADEWDFDDDLDI